MSALHQAVAALIYPTCPARSEGACADCDAKAAVAVGVVLAEATRSIEALPTYKNRLARPHERMLYAPDVLAVLAALGEQRAR